MRIYSNPQRGIKTSPLLETILRLFHKFSLKSSLSPCVLFFITLFVFLSFLFFQASPFSPFPKAQAQVMDGAPLSAPLPSNIWVELSKRVRPSVVGIYVDMGGNQRKDPRLRFLEEFLGPGFEFEAPGGQESSSPIGTGFIIKKEGLVVTNYHVVQATDRGRIPTQIKVKIFGQEDLIPAEIMGKDSRGDLCLLKLKTKKKMNLKVLKFGDSDKVAAGEYVAAFGNPYGYSNSIAVGIISAKGRAIKQLNRFPFLQTDASINPGNSGGPLVNTKGYVIGVNTAIDARAQGIGFAIPSNHVKKIISAIEKGESIQRGFLGIGLMNLTPSMARDYGIQKPGVAVTEVIPSSPAQKGGLRIYDVIIEFDKNKIRTADQLRSHVLDTEVGRTVFIKVLRSSNEGPFKEKTLKVKISAYPSDKKKKETPLNSSYRGRKAPFKMGFSLVNSSSGARRDFGIPVSSPFGPIVSQVEPASPAELGGLRPSDIIRQVNRRDAPNRKKAFSLLRRGTNNLLIQRNNEPLMIFIRVQ